MDKMTTKEYLRINPKATYQEFFAATGLKRSRWYQGRHDLGITNKATPKKKPEILPVTGTKAPSEPSALHKRMYGLENEVRGLRVLVSYLEHQLGLKQSGA
jgi:hypothetical protein